MKSLTVLSYALSFGVLSSLPLTAVAKSLMFDRNGPAKHLRPSFERRDAPQFDEGEPIDGKGKGAPIVGATNHYLDLQQPDNLGKESTDMGPVVNLKWSFSDSLTKITSGGWIREQVISDLPASTDIAAAQSHLKKGALRELHWHTVSEWGYVYAGRIAISAVDDQGRNQWEVLEVGDIWYFPAGEGHTIQGLDDSNEYLQIFDDGNFDALGVTFEVDNWILRTPKDILAKNFGVNESVFANIPTSDPYILNDSPAEDVPPSPYGKLEGNLSYIYHTKKQAKPIQAPGGGGTLTIVDSSNFPIATSIAAAIVEVKPGAMREMHWHPNAQEWLFFMSGTAKATVFVGATNARTFDFVPGDTAVFPFGSGHYIENTSNETLMWIEIYKSDRVVDVSLTQWLALTPASIVAATLNISLAVVQTLKKEKQLIVA